MVRYLTILPRRWEDWSGAKAMIEKEAGHTHVRRGGCCHYLWFHSGLVLALIQLQSGLVWCLFTFCEAFLRSVRNIGSGWQLKKFHFLICTTVGSCPSLRVSDPKWLSVPPLCGESSESGSSAPISHLMQEPLGSTSSRVGSSLPTKAAPPIFTCWLSKLGCFFPFKGGKFSSTL